MSEEKSAQARMEDARQAAWDRFQKNVKPITDAVDALKAEFDKQLEPLRERNAKEYKKYADEYEAIGQAFAAEIEAENEGLTEQDVADLNAIETAPEPTA